MALAAYYAKLVYNANGGSGAPAAQSAFSDEPSSSVYVTLSAGATRQYYRFNGWAPSPSAGSGRTPGQKYYMTTSDTMYAANARVYNLYATWVHETAVLSYNANGGTGAPNSQTVNKNEWFNLRTGVPTRSGYEFVGWNTSSTATAATYQPGDSARIVGNMTLYAVWKVSNSTISSITGSVPIDGTTQGSVLISSINSSYSHELTISIGNSSQVISLAAGVSSANFTIPASWLADVPNSTTGTARASLKTFNGSTQVGVADVKTFSITVPASVVPSVSVSKDYVNSNAVVDGWDILLQNYSQIKLTATAAGGTGASVSNIAFSGDGLSQTGSSNVATSAVLTSSGSRSWTVTVTDSRGRTASTVVTDTVHEYFSPSIESLTAFRSDSSGNRDDAAGTYIKATGTFSYSSCDSHNSLSVDKIEYQAEDASSWTLGQDNAVSGTAYNFGGGNITETKMFHVRLSLTDALGNSAQYVVDVAPIVGYGFGLKNDRVHFGGPCKEPGFVCDFDAKFEGVVDVVQRRAYATLSSAGWYRVLAIDSTAQRTPNNRFQSSLVNFRITTSRGSGNKTEEHLITLFNGSHDTHFADESSTSSDLVIDKIRTTALYVDSKSTDTYVDIHFTGSTTTEVAVYFDVYVLPSVQTAFQAVDLQSVVDSPSGETIMTTYNFIADKRFGSFGTPVTISTFPYTAKEDGFMWVEMRCSSTGRLYANFTGVFICDGYTVAGGYINGTFPVKKGTTIPTPSESNLSSVKYKWYPLG